MGVSATFEVYGEHAEALKEAAYEQAVKFFRCLDEDIILVDMKAMPVVHDAAGESTRWRANILMREREADDDD